jgi:hypothetical protein
MSIKCLLGHKLAIVGLSEYRQMKGLFGILELKQVVRRCLRCRYKELPEWYSEEYRLAYPFVGVDGHSEKWKPEFPGLLE